MMVSASHHLCSITTLVNVLLDIRVKIVKSPSILVVSTHVKIMVPALMVQVDIFVFVCLDLRVPNVRLEKLDVIKVLVEMEQAVMQKVIILATSVCAQLVSRVIIVKSMLMIVFKTFA